MKNVHVEFSNHAKDFIAYSARFAKQCCLKLFFAIIFPLKKTIDPAVSLAHVKRTVRNYRVAILSRERKLFMVVTVAYSICRVTSFDERFRCIGTQQFRAMRVHRTSLNDLYAFRVFHARNTSKFSKRKNLRTGQRDRIVEGLMQGSINHFSQRLELLTIPCSLVSHELSVSCGPLVCARIIVKVPGWTCIINNDRLGYICALVRHCSKCSDDCTLAEARSLLTDGCNHDYGEVSSLRCSRSHTYSSGFILNENYRSRMLWNVPGLLWV